MVKISIVVPALNEAARIDSTLGCLQAARAAGHEVLVVDGGSGDGTVEHAQAGADRVIEAPAGRAGQMNAGAGKAHGDVFWFIHADTLMPKRALGELERALAGGAQWGRFDIRLSGTRPSLRLIERTVNLRSRLTGIATGDQGIFVRRALFERVGGFSDIPLMEDIALSKSLKRFGRPTCLVGPLITSSRRWDCNGTWRTVLLMQRLRMAYFFGVDPAQLYRRYYG